MSQSKQRKSTTACSSTRISTSSWSACSAAADSPSTRHLGVSPVSFLHQRHPRCCGSLRLTTPDKTANSSHRTFCFSIRGAQAMSPSAAASRSLMPPLPTLKAPGVAQEGKNTGEEHFAGLSREHPEILISSLKGCLSWRLSPPLSILRAMVTPGTAAAHRAELLLPWLPGEDLQRELQPRAGAGSGGKSTPAALLLPRPAGDPGAALCPQEGQPWQEAPVQVPAGRGAACMEESPYAKDWTPAPVDASTSPCLAQYICSRGSANKGPSPIRICPARAAPQDPQTHGARPHGAAERERNWSSGLERRSPANKHLGNKQPRCAASYRGARPAEVQVVTIAFFLQTDMWGGESEASPPLSLQQHRPRQALLYDARVCRTHTRVCVHEHHTHVSVHAQNQAMPSVNHPPRPSNCLLPGAPPRCAGTASSLRGAALRARRAASGSRSLRAAEARPALLTRK